jgi:regulator of sirC expression with transglutaminase-like and TPR domain
MKFEAPTALEYFKSLVQGDAGFPLLEAAVSLAQDAHTELDVQDVLAQVDLLLERIKRRIPADASAMHRLTSLNHFFYEELKFAGNSNDFYNPSNSYLHEVLRTRLGIPISLAVLWLELAQGVGLKAHGVNFPGHFLVKVHFPQGQVVMDPLTGRSLSRERLLEQLEPHLQRMGIVGEIKSPLGIYLQDTAPRAIIARMLNNLKEIHSMQGQEYSLVEVQRRLQILGH